MNSDQKAGQTPAWQHKKQSTNCGYFYLSLLVHERHKAKTLWEKTGAVVMVVRRPGWLLCREVWNHTPICVLVMRTQYCECTVELSFMRLCPPVCVGSCWAVLSQVPAAGPWCSSFCRGERKPWQGAGLLQEVLLWESLRGSAGQLSQKPSPAHTSKILSKTLRVT